MAPSQTNSTSRSRLPNTPVDFRQKTGRRPSNVAMNGAIPSPSATIPGAGNRWSTSRHSASCVKSTRELGRETLDEAGKLGGEAVTRRRALIRKEAIGLHSYGFTQTGFLWLAGFTAIQLLLTLLALAPPSAHRSIPR